MRSYLCGRPQPPALPCGHRKPRKYPNAAAFWGTSSEGLRVAEEPCVATPTLERAARPELSAVLTHGSGLPQGCSSRTLLKTHATDARAEVLARADLCFNSGDEEQSEEIERGQSPN